MTQQRNPKHKRGGVKAGVREAAAVRRVRAFELRRAGKSYRAIAAELGVDLRTAYDDVRELLDELAKQATEEAIEVRQIELERLDRYHAAIAEAADDGDEKAIATALRIAERRARLLGLDAPAKVAQTDSDGNDIVAKLSKEELLVLDALLAKATSGA